MSRLNACDDENKNEFKKKQMKKKIIHIFKKNMKFMKKKNAHNITTFYVTLLILHYTYIDADANNVKNTKFFLPLSPLLKI